jgi:hypothetical protein
MFGTVAPCGEATDWGGKAVTEVVDRWRGSGGGGNSKPQVGRGRMQMEEKREMGAIWQNGVKHIGFGLD